MPEKKATSKKSSDTSKKETPKKEAKLKTKKTETKAKTARGAPAKKKTPKKPPVTETNGNGKFRYYEAVGRRKRAVARVRLFTKGEKSFFVNTKPYIEYFKTPQLQDIANGALKKMKVEDKFTVSVIVRGGGQSGQAEAVRHGISRALLRFNPDFQKRLKRAGFLSRDPREKERRKFGLRKARRAPQWSKR